MKAGIIICLTLLYCLPACQVIPEKPQWHINATYHESCSCNAPCPCPFELPMTNSFCRLNSLLDIHEGHFNQIDLSGIKVVISGSVGQWGEYYFHETTSSEQKRSIETILELVDLAGFDTILASELAPIQYEHKDGRVAFSTPHINVVMNIVKGKNNQPVVVQNLKSKLFENYIPHLSHTNIRSFSDSSMDFSYQGKAGFTSKWKLTHNDYQ